MRLIACMLVRNEDWILGLSARVALTWCDALVVGLHACTDRSRAILDQITVASECRLEINCITFDNPTWDEMTFRHAMLQRARELGATHVAIVDADEVLTANIPPEKLRELVEQTPPGHMLMLPGYNLRGGIGQYHANGIWGDRWFSFAFRDYPILRWEGDVFHQREPLGFNWRYHRPVAQGGGGILHFWGASEDRLRAKHALYKLTERLRWPHKAVSQINRDYNRALDPSADVRFDQDWKYRAVPEGWLWKDWLQFVEVDAVPWQDAEIQRLVAEHGASMFRGLMLPA